MKQETKATVLDALAYLEAEALDAGEPESVQEGEAHDALVRDAVAVIRTALRAIPGWEEA